MGFHERDYDVYVLLPSPAARGVWQWDVWQNLVPILEPLMRLASEKPAIRTTQFAGKKPVAFGRLGWTTESMQKWTHESPATPHDRTFISVEVWAPSWTVCEREGRAPDVFFSAFNEKAHRANEKLLFGQRVLLAVANDLGEPALVRARRAVIAMADMLESVLTIHRKRAWGKPFGSSGFTDAIQDILLTGLFKVGKVHERPLDLSTFVEEWETVASSP